MSPLRALATPLLAMVALSAPVSVEAHQWTPQIRIDSIFSTMDTDVTPGCAVSVMREGSPIYEQGYGMANLEYGIPITPTSIFHVASVSKHFTAMAVELRGERLPDPNGLWTQPRRARRHPGGR